MSDLSKTVPTQQSDVVPFRQKKSPLMGNHWMETASGKRIDYLTPNPKNITIEDIAWSLSRLPRFLGHTGDIEPYTVAVHSVWVAMYVWAVSGSHLAGLHALLHDAHEAFMGDIPKPLKSLPGLRDEIHRIERGLQEAIYKALELPWPTPEELQLIAEADEQALAMEARMHMHSCGASWDFLPDTTPTSDAMGKGNPKRPTLAFEQFLTSYNIFNTKVKA